MWGVHVPFIMNNGCNLFGNMTPLKLIKINNSTILQNMSHSIGVYVCKVFCLEAGSSLDMHYQSSTYLSLIDKRKE